MHGRHLQLAILLAVCLLACAASTGASGASFTSYQVETAGFAIAAPSTWVDVTTATSAELAKLATNPALAATVKLATETDVIRLIVADPTSGGRGYLTAGAQRVGTVSAAKIVAATVKQLSTLSEIKGKVTSSTVALPAASADAIQFELAGPSGALENIEYLLFRDQVEYVFAFAAPKENWAKYKPLFLESARSFRYLKAPDLSGVVLTGAQVGAGYELASFAGGNSVIGEATLDLCAASYPSEVLRIGRLQVSYTHRGAAVSVSNEVVTYLPGGAQEALSEVAGVAKSCARKTVVRKSGAVTTTFSVSPLSDPNLTPGTVAVRIEDRATDGKKRYAQSGVAIYQVRGNTLSGVYTFVTKGTTIAQATRIAFHSAEQSKDNLADFVLAA